MRIGALRGGYGSLRMHLDVSLLKTTFRRFNADKVPRLAAALSYTTIFAIAPVLSKVHGQLLTSMTLSRSSGVCSVKRGPVPAMRIAAPCFNVEATLRLPAR